MVKEIFRMWRRDPNEIVNRHYQSIFKCLVPSKEIHPLKLAVISPRRAIFKHTIFFLTLIDTPQVLC